MTINDAISGAMQKMARPLSSQEAYDYIIAHELYEFHAQNPHQIVRSQIRRHCKGLEFPSAATKKYYEMTDDGRFQLLAEPVSFGRKRSSPKQRALKSTLDELKKLHSAHTDALKDQILTGLKTLTPGGFEVFSKKLLEVYGFEKMKVTNISKDGGIDGHGQLKVGLAYMNVAFQSKKWTKGSVGRPEIDKFRGAIQGDYEQGLFFTTSRFTAEAQEYSIKRGAVPVILIDGNSIVDLMIQKTFGVEQEFLPVYSNALDAILETEDD
jgi:restriction system protein